MQVIFCTECGGKNEYSGSKPKFCSSCGTPINEESKQSKAKENKEPRQPRVKRSPGSFREQMEARQKKRESASDGETDIDHVPNLSSLEYEIIKDGNNVYNFNDIIDVAEEKPKKE